MDKSIKNVEKNRGVLKTNTLGVLKTTDKSNTKITNNNKNGRK